MKLAQIINPAAKYAEQIQAHLDDAPQDEVFSVTETAARVGMKRHGARQGAAMLPPPYVFRRDATSTYLGHPKAIAALRKGLGVK
jgi:hypothetical protein